MKWSIGIILGILELVLAPYPPNSDEVMPGTVLLPATRRGRYLANIIRRQAVDGTGIKFHKDADRLNAEAKKKVDVLSEEMLPYIIAEQERRVTLHRRIMSAIQNGEKGVTIAEIRNKPPVIIRKGMLYRCPANRLPREPDGSGVLSCDDDIIPTPIMYDSCLSAEDRPLYATSNHMFFCNRHRIEGPELPRNGSTVVACAPSVRTTYNYTTTKCVLDDSDDVVVHYRYYPDRTYKFVSELDPEREVCDHWNPCQVGYIFSVTTLDQAIPALELWADFQEKFEEYERDEIIPAVPEDSREEYVSPLVHQYRTSPRLVTAPPGYTLRGIRWSTPAGITSRLEPNFYEITPVKSKSARRQDQGNSSFIVTLKFHQFSPRFYGKYRVVFIDGEGRHAKTKKFLELVQARTLVSTIVAEKMPGQNQNKTNIQFSCMSCRLLYIIVRGNDAKSVYNLNSIRFGVKRITRNRKVSSFIQLDLQELQAHDFGDYFAIIQTSDGVQERIFIASIRAPAKDLDNVLQVATLRQGMTVGKHYDMTSSFNCDSCTLDDIVCSGQSVLAAGRVSVVPEARLISFNFPRFDDTNSCAYIGFFQQGGHHFKKILAVIENEATDVEIQKDNIRMMVGDKTSTNPPIAPGILMTPEDGTQVQVEIPYTCSGCTVAVIYVNGMKLEENYDPAAHGGVIGSFAIYAVEDSKILIRINSFQSIAFEGVYQATFTSDRRSLGGQNITKTILEFQEEGDVSAAPPEAGGAEDRTEGGNSAERGESITTTTPAPEEEKEITVSEKTPDIEISTSENPSSIESSTDSTISTAENPSSIESSTDGTISTAENPSSIESSTDSAISTAENPSSTESSTDSAISTAENPSTIESTTQSTSSTSE